MGLEQWITDNSGVLITVFGGCFTAIGAWFIAFFKNRGSAQNELMRTALEMVKTSEESGKETRKLVEAQGHNLTEQNKALQTLHHQLTKANQYRYNAETENVMYKERLAKADSEKQELRSRIKVLEDKFKKLTKEFEEYRRKHP